MLRTITISFLAISCMMLFPILAQDRLKNGQALSEAIDSKNYQKADSLLQLSISQFTTAKNFDTLSTYIQFVGDISYKQNGPKPSIKAVYDFIEWINENDSSLNLLIKCYSNAAEFFGNIGQNSEAYTACKKQAELALKTSGDQRKEIAFCEYNMGVYAQRLADISLSTIHHRKALQLYESSGASAEDIYLSSNAMAACMWYASKYDSANYFYQKALTMVKKLPILPINQFFRPAIIENNIAGLYSAEGKTSDAIAAMERSIHYYQQFIAIKEAHPKKYQAMSGLCEAIDNLAGIYKEIGDYRKAGDLLQYAYQQKKKLLNPDEPDIFISEILLGQHYNSIHRYEKALQFLQSGGDKIAKADGDYLYWQAYAQYGLAMAHENLAEIELAKVHYARATNLFDSSYQGSYDNARMDFSRNAALFYAKHTDASKASRIANDVLTYLSSVKEETSLQAFYQLLNIAEIKLETTEYEEVIKFSNRALEVLRQKIRDSRTLVDSVKMEVFQPKAILLSVKAIYYLKNTKDTILLEGLSNQLTNALQLLDKRKLFLDDIESINILIADNKELIAFAKKIILERYQLTNNPSLLDEFINLHESAIYNRIRIRLDKEKAIQFANLPDSVLEEEKKLKAAIPAALTGQKPNSELLKDYLAAIQQWQSHLISVKKEFPAYHEMRYGKNNLSATEVQSAIPSKTTLIRYYFTYDKLVALVMDSTKIHLIELDSSNLAINIKKLMQPATNEKDMGMQLNELYKKLWEPLEGYINTQKIIVIPDGILYNLSFDLLTPTTISQYKDLINQSLLNKHQISYHYSLSVLNQQKISQKIKNNYVAFAPGFSDELKNTYLANVQDSLKLDFQYLSLLPQPNTSRLTRSLRRLMGGNTYLDQESTPSSFRQNASGHKIVHVGTHAEYNNINPEKTRLIFAKTGEDPGQDNSLFLTDIYQCDIRSELTLLTACESGRPGYQDGEGMISLAHAFNYAGSKSILTGLWKLDEQATNMITEKFVKYLTNQKPTDEALQLAKLDYLKEADGRMLAPIYWAGLVMMGEPSVIKLEKQSSSRYYIWATIILVIAVFAGSTYKHFSKN